VTNNPGYEIPPELLGKVREWIDEQGEVLIILRYLRMAGAKDFALCRSIAEFESIVEDAPVGADIEVVRHAGLPLRGIVDSEFIEAAVRSVRDDEEYLILTTETGEGCLARHYDWDWTHANLRSDLNELLGVEVRMGACPEFMCADRDGLISATKGGMDGPR
jgi:hypothetical protein